MMPLVSVIIPVKDQASRLALTLVALEHQREVEGELEVIVVDDGSAEPVEEVLAGAVRNDSYAFRILECSSLGARGVPRNLGAAAARGELLLFLDADACPSTQLVSKHCRQHAGRSDCIALGDCYVIERTGTLADPTRGIPFHDTRAIASGAPPLLLSPEQLRRQGDAALESHSAKGIYPGHERMFRQLEWMLTAGSRLAWAGVIPHNLSMRRTTFETVGGFDSELLDSEGWDFGIRALQKKIPCVLAPAARSFHLYHCREKTERINGEASTPELLLQRYPDAGIEALYLWWSALCGDVYVPAELGLSDMRVIEAWLDQPGGARHLRELYLQHSRSARSSMDHWLGSLNSSVRLSRQLTGGAVVT